jgi:pre-mRNA cleavage complex 2 protein Pcf11
LPVQFKQCGIRFEGNFAGKKEMQDHRDISVDGKGKGHTDGHRLLNANAAAELRAFYVVVPPGNEAKPVSCPIFEDIIK